MRRLGRKLGFMLLWPGLFLYFFGSRRTRTVLLHNNEILLVQDGLRFFNDGEAWTLPGGGIKRGEDVNIAAVREVQEELGITINPDTLTLLATQQSGGYGLTYQAYFLLYECAARPEIGKLSHEIGTARWFSITAAEKLLHKREVTQALALLAAHR